MPSEGFALSYRVSVFRRVRHSGALRVIGGDDISILCHVLDFCGVASRESHIRARVCINWNRLERRGGERERHRETKRQGKRETERERERERVRERERRERERDEGGETEGENGSCLLYTSDAADDC